GPVPRSGIPPVEAVLPSLPRAFRYRSNRSCPLPFRFHLRIRAVPRAPISGLRRAPFPKFSGLPKPPPYVPIIALYSFQLAEVLDPCSASVVPLTDDPS